MTDREKLIEAVARAFCAHDYGNSCADADMPFREMYCEDASIALSAIETAGYVLVPLEPTEAMVDAMHAASDEYKSWVESKIFPRPIKVAHLYAAALAASPMGEKAASND